MDLNEDGNSVTLDISVDTAEVTSFEDTYKEFVEGVAEWSISADFFWNGASAKNDATLFALIGGGSKAIEFGPEGDASTKVKYTGNVIMTGLSINPPVGGPVVLSFTGQGTGALTRGTF